MRFDDRATIVTDKTEKGMLIFRVNDYMLPYPRKKEKLEFFSDDHVETLDELDFISIGVGLVEV